MPICKKCEAKFPARIYVDGKRKNLRNRKYCLDCSPFNQHNTKKLHLDEAESSVCVKCGRVYIYDRNKGHRKTKCNSCAFDVNRRVEQKLKSIQYKGGACIACGYNKCVAALVFHHKDPKEKDFDITGILRKWETIQSELDKCDLLCCRCHTELHYDTTH